MSTASTVESTGVSPPLSGLAPPQFERPTHGETVLAILEEARAKGRACDHDKAQRVYGLLYRAVKYIRGRDSVMYHLSDGEIIYLHDVLDAVMPDDVVNPASGSAQDIIHRHFLAGDEFALVHTKDGPRLEYCAVALEMRSAA